MSFDHGDKNLINVTSNWSADGRGPWVATFVYGSLDRKPRRELLKLSDLAEENNSSRLFIGDLNDREKSSRAADIHGMKLPQNFMDTTGWWILSWPSHEQIDQWRE